MMPHVRRDTRRKEITFLKVVVFDIILTDKTSLATGGDTKPCAPRIMRDTFHNHSDFFYIAKKFFQLFLCDIHSGYLFSI